MKRSRKTLNRWTQLRSELGIAKKRKSGYHDTWRLWGKPRNARYREFQFNPRKFEPSKHKRGFLLLFLIGIAVFIGAWSQDPSNILFHSYHPQTVDPYTLLWHDPGSFSSTGGFNCISGVSCFSASGVASLLLSPGLSGSVALTKSSITDLSTISAKEVLFQNTWRLSTSAFVNGKTFGWYLTTNGTLPTQPFYDPFTDPAVAMIFRLTTQSVSSFGVDLFMQRTIGTTQTIGQENVGNCDPAGSVFFCNSSVNTGNYLDSNSLGIDTNLFLNFTGQGSNSGAGCTSTIGGGLPVNLNGPSCSWLLVSDDSTPSTNATSTKHFPWFNFQSQQYYLGFYASSNLFSGAGFVRWTFDNPTTGLGTGNVAGLQTTHVMAIYTFIPAVGSSTLPTLDTGGFFGPIIRALINLGVFILNSILGFIGYITPALEAAFNFLESVVKTILNGVGSAFGFPSSPGLGDDLFSFINSLITLFTVQVPNAFTQITNIFNGWVNLLTVIFTTGIIGQIFKFLSDTLGFAVNLASFAWTVFNLAGLTYSIGAPWWLFIFAIAFNCDDGVEGWIKTWEFAKWLAFDIGVKTITWLLNWAIDVTTAAIGFIPKPFIQMASARFPRIPVIDIHGSFSMPRFDGAALKEGNLFAVFGFPSIVAGLIWYELTQTGIPGTLAALYSTQPWVNTATVAITFYKIFLPIFGLTIFLLMIPTLFTNIFGVRVQGGMPVSVGHRPSGVTLRGGTGRPFVSKSKKHLQGRLERIISERESIEKRARQASEKASLTREKKEQEQKAQKELAQREIERRPSGKDIKGPRLGPLDQE